MGLIGKAETLQDYAYNLGYEQGGNTISPIYTTLPSYLGISVSSHDSPFSTLFVSTNTSIKVGTHAP